MHRGLIVSQQCGLLSWRSAESLFETNRQTVGQRAGALWKAAGRLFVATMPDGRVQHGAPHTPLAWEAVSVGQEVERLCVSHDGNRLYVLLGDADHLLMFDVPSGQLLIAAPAGIHPRDMQLDATGRLLAVAGGASGTVLVFRADTLEQLAEYEVDGVACGVLFGAGKLLTLCAAGDYELYTHVGEIALKGGMHRTLAVLSGLPGSFVHTDAGVLVGALGECALLDTRRAHWRWHVQVTGLPHRLLTRGQHVYYLDGLEGMLGVIDCKGARLLQSTPCADLVDAVFYP